MSGDVLREARAFLREWASTIPNSGFCGELSNMAMAMDERHLAPLAKLLNRRPTPTQEMREACARKICCNDSCGFRPGCSGTYQRVIRDIDALIFPESGDK